jgi:CubicO group peptidase (beta-lactamase class C family)
MTSKNLSIAAEARQRRSSFSRIRVPLALAACVAAAPLAARAQNAANLQPVYAPNFYTPQIGFYASWIYPTAGADVLWGNPGDINANPAAGASGATVRRAGMYLTSGTNIAESWCNPNYYWINEGAGVGPLGATYKETFATKTNGNCYMNVTIGDALRRSIPNVPVPPAPPASTGYPLPSTHVPYTFNVAAFAHNLEVELNAGHPAPVGWQLAVRDPEGRLVFNRGYGSVTGSAYLPATPMTPGRRFDVASMSKTITAVAVMAALEQLAAHKPALDVKLDSSILPYLPSTWTPHPLDKDVTFRSLLRHTSGFCGSFNGVNTNIPGGDAYGALGNMVEYGPYPPCVGKWEYSDYNYALLRVVLAYLVDGPQTFRPFETNGALNAQITALSYRNYVRNRVFDPLGMPGVDDFYTGALPETIYFDQNRVAIPDNLNVPGSGYDMTADEHVLTAGSGNWTISASEYSAFISALWRGKIISPSSVAAMLAQNDPLSNDVGIGMYGSQLSLGGQTYTDYNENGGGGLGGPQGTWMTFFNGYTAVMISNTAWGLGNVGGYQALERAFVPALKRV